MIGSLLAGLPVEEGEEFREEFMTVRRARPFSSSGIAADSYPRGPLKEYADVQLTSYLATLTKSAHSLNNVRHSLSLSHPRSFFLSHLLSTRQQFTDKFTSLHALAGSDRLEGGAMGMFAGGADSFMGGMAKGGGGGGRNGGRRLGGAGAGRFA